MYIASQLLTRQELFKFKDIFNCFDFKGNGVISTEDLIELIMQYLGFNKERAAQEANKVMESLDIN